jgi:2-C-methyl-D-erythritol 4-phosphate cytidylyltransferase
MSFIKTNHSAEGVILAGGSGERLGKGPKAFVRIGEQTLLEIAISTMVEVTSRVVAALPAERLSEADEIIPNDVRVAFIAGGNRRIDTLRLLVENSQSEWLILHDVVHPLVSSTLAATVLQTAMKHGAAAAALPLFEFVYNAAGKKVAQPGESFIIQKPIAFRRSDAVTGFQKMVSLGISDDLGVLEVLSLAGISTTFVNGSPENQKITKQSDLQLASILFQSR